MANKPVKIKRNTSVSGKKWQRRMAAKKLLAVLLVLGALLAIGFFGAPAVVEMLGNMGQPDSESIAPPAEPTPTPTPENTDSSSDSETVQEVVETQQVYAALTYADLANEAAMQQKAQQLAAKGVTRATVALKDRDGLVHFDTQTAIGAQAKATSLVDVKLAVKVFAQQDITLVAEIYTFMDKNAPVIDRTTAVKYVGSDFNWLDSSKEFGGKPWANPASSTMQQYIGDLVGEIHKLGVDNFIFSAVQLPTGYSLDKRDFGVSESALEAQLQGFINDMENKVAAFGGDAFFAFDVTAANGGDVAKYIVAPQRLGAANMVLVGKNEDFEGVDIDALGKKLKDGFNVEKLLWWNTEADVSSENDSIFVK
ncbi:MAG: hypothetical protein IIV99_00010 [Oscillospiraceae bacterium]|nr:hypothetical protein [Oscillospiraceae bacterium]